MAAKILIVDDEPDLEMLIRQRFRRQIRDGKFEFAFALNGLEALAKLDQDKSIDVVVTDINMPEMDGLTLLVRLNEVNPIIKAIIISAYGDMKNIRTAMNRGAFDFIIKPINFDDLEITLDKTLNYVLQLKNTLKSIKENNILKMYVDQNVLSFMTRKEFEHNLMLNESINATVMFVDICGFTAISERFAADTVIKLLNSYFDEITKSIIDNHGYVDKFMGDAVMAIFRGEDHLGNAIKAALVIRQRINEIIAARPEGSDYSPRVSIGINSGDMVSGNIGSQSLARLDYTVIGDVVNTASRFQSIAAPGQIIVGQDVFARIEDRFHCEKIGTLRLKNKSADSVVYNILDER